MTTTLESMVWGGPARQLLECAKDLEPGKPAVMQIRHTARNTVTKEQAQRDPKFDGRSLPSTNEGIQAAIDFGSSLPKSRSYTLYNTYVERTLETAQGIMRGMKNSGIKAQLGGKIPCDIHLDPEASFQWAKKQKWFPEYGAYNTTCKWIAGLRPTSVLRPSADYSREVAGIVVGNLVGVSGDAFHLYVSHDNWVQALVFHWFGVPPEVGGLRYLDGFLVQFVDDEMRVWFRGKCDAFDYPYWWPKFV